jgi:hypothetical protein
MATRAFIDRSGVEWLVWHVRPGQHTGRVGSSLPDELVEGWLCLESTAGKRRFYPVPPDWESIPDDKFEILLHASIAVGPRAAHRNGTSEAAAT